MALHDPTPLYTWMSMTNGTERMNLSSYGLTELFSLFQKDLNADFMRAAISHWDLVYHVFRFNGLEICPMFEEFCSILGYDPSSALVLSPYETSSPARDLASLLVRSVTSVRQFFRDDVLNIRLIIAQFADPGDLGDRAYQDTRKAALALCMTCHFLFSTNSTIIAHVCLQLKDWMNPMALVLAETLNGLDEAHAGRTLLGSGAPLVLQAWLYERLQLLTAPERPLYPWYQRTVLHSDYSFNRWMTWMSQLAADDILWTCPSWDIHAVTVQFDGFHAVWLPGLKRTSFYLPDRLARQYMQPQETPGVMSERVRAARVRPNTIDAFTTAWANRHFAYF